MLFLAAFTAAASIGFVYYQSPRWNYVDLVYYPLAAIGVILLFSSNEVQRKLFALNSVAENSRTALETMQRERPNIEIGETEAAFDSSLQSIKVIRDSASVCAQPPSSATGQCLAAVRFAEPTAAFLSTAQAAYPNFEDRLLASCAAADKLIESLTKGDRMSSLVAGPMASLYLSAVSSRTSLVSDALSFKENMQVEIDKLHQQAFKPTHPGSALLHEIQYEEASLAQLILFGISKCTTAPRQQLEHLGKWKVSTRTKQQELVEIENQRLALREQTVSASTFSWIQLNLWPYVLIAALSLKFGKGVAAVRKAS
ncbi:hypothetical protein U737_19160 [Methylomonas sp. LW13]|nr:hypothetical protein [Methylomonas sp. Kb3]PKD38420.1 hypothetical protein CWO84_19425 [Methylomonas sp. Kb3]QBC28855.1 hypothetical protein U737_19160 [Methylomonas sp. LW13]